MSVNQRFNQLKEEPYALSASMIAVGFIENKIFMAHLRFVCIKPKCEQNLYER